MKVQYNLLFVALLLGSSLAVRFSSEKNAMNAGSRQVHGDSAQLVTPSDDTPDPIVCNVQFCDWCAEDPDYCSQCQEGLLNLNGQCVPPDCEDPNCDICDQQNKATCYLCRHQYYLDNGICVNPYCKDPNCLQCSQDQNTCFRCPVNFDLIEGSCVCINPEEGPKNCSAHCVRCTNYVVCDQCEPGWYTFVEGNHKICKQCTVQHCGICPDDTSYLPEDNGVCDCEKCAANHHKISFGNECKCLSCNVPHCAECDDQAQPQCKRCQDHYGLVFNEETQRFECIPCFNDPYWNGEISWQHPDCLTCDENQCKHCDQTKNQELYDKTCRDKCNVDPCYRCDPTNPDVCIDCNRADLWLTPQGTCQTIQICPQPRQENPTRQDEFGNSFVDFSSCVCIDDFHFDESINDCRQTCHLTVQNDFCDECEEFNGYRCKICHEGFELIDGSCYSICNIANCETCTNFKVYECHTCHDGFYQHHSSIVHTDSDPTSNQDYNQVDCWRTCDPQVQYCNRCEDQNSGRCQVCKNGFSDSDGDGQCECDIAGCDECYDDNNGKRCQTCEACRTKSLDELSCTPTCDIPDPCISCELSVTGDNCDITRKTCNECKDNTYKLSLLEDGRKICVPICNDSNCDDCLAEDRDHCNHCIGSWSVVGNRCVCEVPKCTTCDSQRTGGYCTDCWSQYTLTENDQVCDCNLGGNHCLYCDDNDYGKCVECDDDKYQVQDGQCVPSPCVDNDQENYPNTFRCRICVDYDLDRCEVCHDGYVHNPKNNDRCDPPCNDDTCKICAENHPDGHNCDQCITGYHYSSSYGKCWPDCVDEEGCDIPDDANCVCQLCKEGWYWDHVSSSCTQTCQVARCETCTRSSAYKCSQCNDNYHHFQTDINDINTQDTCECEDSQCADCTTQGTYCTLCHDGTDGFIWLPVNGVCYPQCLVPFCDHCKDKIEGNCEPVCLSDFVATQTQFGWDCLPNCNLNIDNDHCSTCAYTENPLLSQPDCCAQCIIGWHVENCVCVPDCNLNEYCDRCVEGNPDCCDTCLPGQNFQKNGCDCECIQGYVYYDTLSPDQCLECRPDNCAQCVRNDQDTCQDCEPEYKLVGGLCERKNCTELQQNIRGCEYCTDNQCCDQCQAGYVSTPIEGREGCFYCDLPCVQDVFPHCETCLRDGSAGSENHCLSCRAPNYRLDGTVCRCSVPNCANCQGENNGDTAQCYACSPGWNLNQEKTECVQCSALRTWSASSNRCVCINGYVEVGPGQLADDGSEIQPGCYPKCSALNKGCSICQWVDPNDQSKGRFCLQCTNPSTQTLDLPDRKKCKGICDVPGCLACSRDGDTCICNWQDEGWTKEFNYDRDGQLIVEKCVPPCNVQNCFECQNNDQDGTYDQNTCVVCRDGYNQINGQCVKPCNQDPKECSECHLYNPDCCKTCTDLYSDQDGCSCRRPCNLYNQHCTLCVEGDANSCENCKQGYSRVDIGGGVFECQLDCTDYTTNVDPNCVQCVVRDGQEQAAITNSRSQLRCNQCKSQWWIVQQDGVCAMKCDTNVVVHCQKCKDDQQENCETCVDTHPWIVLNEPDGHGGCHSDCDDPNCDECQFEDNTQCVRCKGNNIYKIDENGDCIPNCSDPQCIECSVNSLDVCITCKDGWTPDNNGVCKQNCLFFDTNCTLCDSNQPIKNDRCLECKDPLWSVRYDDNSGLHLCWPPCNQLNCYRCTDNDSDSCHICDESYHVYQGQCVPDCDNSVSHCLYCEEGNRNRCALCDSNNGLVGNLIDGVCSNICESFKGVNCAQTNLFDPEGFESTDNCRCTQCNVGYVINNNDQRSCLCDVSNLDHCLICSIPGTCIECDDPNYHVVNGQCELRPCQPNCLTCPPTDVDCCTEPADRFALCGDCPFHELKACTDYDPNCVDCSCTHCTQCDVDHELDPETSKCFYEHPCYKSQITGADQTSYKYFPNCEQCDGTLGDSKGCCTDCIQRFYVDNCDCTKCPDDHCLECPNGQCNQCELYYGLDHNHDCQKCPDNCHSCDGDTTQCKECDEGYYLIDGQCHECSKECKICTNNECKECTELGWYPVGDKCNPCSEDNCSICPNDYCEACFEGFFFKYYQNNWHETIRECVPCKVSHCRYCNRGPNTCTECEEGWELPCEGEDKECVQSGVKSAQHVYETDQSGYTNLFGESSKKLRDGQINKTDN